MMGGHWGHTMLVMFVVDVIRHVVSAVTARGQKRRYSFNHLAFNPGGNQSDPAGIGGCWPMLVI